MRVRSWRCLLVFALCFGAAAQTSKETALGSSTSSTVKNIVDTAAAEFLKNDSQAVGISIGVLKDGSSYTYNYGSKNKGGKTLPAADSLYPIASVTKTFTGILCPGSNRKAAKFEG